jgi:hypothetical protein
MHFSWGCKFVGKGGPQTHESWYPMNNYDSTLSSENAGHYIVCIQWKTLNIIQWKHDCMILYNSPTEHKTFRSLIMNIWNILQVYLRLILHQFSNVESNIYTKFPDWLMGFLLLNIQWKLAFCDYIVHSQC